MSKNCDQVERERDRLRVFMCAIILLHPFEGHLFNTYSVMGVWTDTEEWGSSDRTMIETESFQAEETPVQTLRSGSGVPVEPRGRGRVCACLCKFIGDDWGSQSQWTWREVRAR